jgi:thioredoxin 1
MIPTKNKLQVLHFAQIPCKPFRVDVKDEKDALRVIKILAEQHLFLYEHKIIPDYANVLMVNMFEDGEWVNYYSEDEMDWDEVRQELERVSSTVEITDENYEQIIMKSELPVIVKFGADWSGPCRMVNPIIKELAEEYQGRVVVAMVNVDDCYKTKDVFGIRSIPQVMYFNKGEKLGVLAGAQTKDTYIKNMELFETEKA